MFMTELFAERCVQSKSKKAIDLIGRMRTPIWEAFSYGIGHGIRHVHCDSVKHKVILH